MHLRMEAEELMSFQVQGAGESPTVSDAESRSDLRQLRHIQALVGKFPFSVQNLPCGKCLHSADPVPRGDATDAGRSGALLRGGCRTYSAFYGCAPPGMNWDGPNLSLRALVAGH